jgi:LPXTG-site transpeptidase (sortase) family protein
VGAALVLLGAALLARPWWGAWRERVGQQVLARQQQVRGAAAPTARGALPAAPGRPSRQPPSVARRADPARGPAAYAELEIPALGLHLWVVQGVTLTDDAPLAWGPGHLVGSGAPGSVGNVVIFGHRDEDGSPFGTLYRLRKGDAIVLLRAGRAYRYYVSSIQTVPPEDLAVLRPVPGRRLLTLVTCGGPPWPLPGANTVRLVVQAALGPA